MPLFTPTLPSALFPELDYHIAWTDATRKLRPLLDAPRPDETKLQQIVRFLEEQCAYQREADKQACLAKRAAQGTPNPAGF